MGEWICCYSFLVWVGVVIISRKLESSHNWFAYSFTRLQVYPCVFTQAPNPQWQSTSPLPSPPFEGWQQFKSVPFNFHSIFYTLTHSLTSSLASLHSRLLFCTRAEARGAGVRQSVTHSRFTTNAMDGLVSEPSINYPETAVPIPHRWWRWFHKSHTTPSRSTLTHSTGPWMIPVCAGGGGRSIPSVPHHHSRAQAGKRICMESLSCANNINFVFA